MLHDLKDYKSQTGNYKVVMLIGGLIMMIALVGWLDHRVINDCQIQGEKYD